MRILHVIQELRTGGAERVVISLARGASSAGHRVAVASGPGELRAELVGEHFAIPMLRRRPWVVVPAAAKLAHVVHSWRPDIVHCHNPGMAAVTSLATMRGRSRPTLVSVHGGEEEDWPATARVLRLAGLRLVACGPGVEDALRDYGHEPLATIWNGVGPAPPPADRATLERAWNLPPGRPLIVSVGRLVPRKNHALAIRAIAGIPAVNLVVLGEGPLRDELAREVTELGVSDRVRLAGVRPDARAIMGAAVVIVLPSRAEGLPVAALEALASGRPFVATDVRGLRELLSNGKDALLVPSEDTDALTRALERVLTDGELRRTLTENGLRLAQARSETSMVEAFLDLYERVADR
jgi:glycosyltransferase involved in cell wall biosynthesis